MILGLAYNDAINDFEKFSDPRFTQKAVVKMIVTHYPTFPWILKSQLFNRKYVSLLVWEGERGKEKESG